MAQEAPQITYFKKFIEGKKIIIADPTSVSRSAVGSLLSSLGAKGLNMTLVDNYESALKEIDKIRPHVLICEYELGGKPGIDLVMRARQHRPETRDTLFLIFTANTSQSAVAQAAEDNLDSYILKPFTNAVLQATILQTVEAKINPTTYQKMIDDGRIEIAKGNVTQAMRIFTEAIPLEKDPALAYSYLAQISFMKGDYAKAEETYKKGLSGNPIHYRCMVGLYETLMAQKKHDEAYVVIKKLSETYPANPQRLSAVLRLAILTKNYDDIDRYYDAFVAIDEKGGDLTKYISAALVVCGKHFLKQKMEIKGVDLLRKAAKAAGTRTVVLREIISALVEAGLAEEADKFLTSFPKELQSGLDYAVMDFVIADATLVKTKSISRGRQLISNEIHDPVVYQIVILRMVETGMKHGADELVDAATKKWPDRADSFRKILLKTGAPPIPSAKQGAATSGTRPSKP